MVGPGPGRRTPSACYDGIKAQNPNTTFTQGCTINDVDPPNNTPADECGSDAGFAAAVAAADNADQVVLALGESRGHERRGGGALDHRPAGQAAGADRPDQGAPASRSSSCCSTAARSRSPRSAASRPAILEAWFPGVEAGNAVADVLFGKVNPGGKLPVSFPQRLGQVPIYYNHEPTGRPCDVTQKYDSRYRDLRTCDPLYPFGYGLSYTTFAVSEPAARASRPSSRTGSVHGVDDGHQHRQRWPATTSRSSTSTTRWRASRSRSAGCAASSG